MAIILLRGILFASAAIYAFLAAYCIRHWRNQLSPRFSLLSLGAVVYTAGYAFELGAQDLETIIFWLKIESFGLSLLPVLWVLVAYRSNFNRELSPGIIAALLVVPVFSTVFMSTNEYHGLYFRSIAALEVDGHLIADAVRGPWFYVFIVYTDICILASLAMFFVSLRDRKGKYSRRSFWLMLGSVFIMFLQIIYALGFSPYDIDISAFGFLGAGILQSVAIIRYDLLRADSLVKETILSGISEGIIVADAGHRITDFNRAGTALFPWLGPDAIGKRLEEFPDGVALEESAVHHRLLLLEKGGPRKWLDVKVASLSERGKDAGKVFLISDVTTVQRILRKLYRLANYDYLTKIFNRRRFFDDAGKEAARVLRYGHSIAVLMIDLDHFKHVNDTWGHQVGDKVLAAVAKTIRQRIRTTDIFGRYGGEEFAIVLVSVDASQAMLVSESIRSLVEGMVVRHEDHEIRITVSIGVALPWPDPDAKNLESLIHAADSALYQAKAGGRNRVVVLETNKTRG